MGVKVKLNDGKAGPDGERIRELRMSLGLRRTEFGAKIGYSHQQIVRIEDGLTPVSDEVCRLLCREYGVSEEWLAREQGAEELHLEEDSLQRRERLRMVYKESGLTQREFGEYTHTATSMLNDVISGRKQMTIRYAQKIEDTLNVGTDWLLFGDEAAKDYPCGESMMQFLKKHPEIRKGIWDKMQAESESG